MAPMWQDEEEPQWGADEPEAAATPAAGAAAPAGAEGEKKEGEAPADGAAAGEAPVDPDEVDTKKYNK